MCQKCKQCEHQLTDERIKLGYDVCVECSDTQKYSSHTVYPHKTGGYIQPVSSEKSDELKRLDRRGVGGNKRAKGIFADNSWDRWLKKYNEQVPNRKRARIANPLLVGSTPTLLSIQKATKLVMTEFDSRGYQAACNYTQSLYSDDKITLMNKSTIMNELASQQMMTTKQRKFMRRL